MDRSLRLRRETLTELSSDELVLVVGGEPTQPPQPTPPIFAPTHNCQTLLCC